MDSSKVITDFSRSLDDEIGPIEHAVILGWTLMHLFGATPSIKWQQMDSDEF